jgi:hypothetical protein
MKEYVHLKDGVVFAHHKTENDVDDSSENVIEVAGDLDSYLNKKYENKQFVDAPIIKYAILDKNNDNTVIQIFETFFLSDVKDNPIITDDNVKVMWKWDGTKFISPNFVEKAEEIFIPNAPKAIDPSIVLTKEQIQASVNQSIIIN